jgi:hypothetical protein
MALLNDVVLQKQYCRPLAAFLLLRKLLAAATFRGAQPEWQISVADNFLKWTGVLAM